MDGEVHWTSIGVRYVRRTVLSGREDQPDSNHREMVGNS